MELGKIKSYTVAFDKLKCLFQFTTKFVIPCNLVDVRNYLSKTVFGIVKLNEHEQNM